MCKFYKADLHIHTPESDCYCGEKSDDVYISILEKAKKENIDIIAITDHNTTRGFDRLIEMHSKMKAEYDVLSRYANSIPKSDDLLNNLKRKIDLYSSILIIPGVEITINPGVHIIVLSDINEKDDIDRLLIKMGYTKDRQGYDAFVTNMDLKDFLEQSELQGKIVICPHVDQDKGVYDVLTGAYRAYIFRLSIINGFTCNSVSQLQKIKNNLFSQPEYKRTSPLAFLNASDAHNIDSIGSKYSFFRLSQLTFQSLISAFGNPEQCISDDNNPKFRTIIKKCMESGKTILLNSLAKEDLVKAICAILNCGYGHIILGITENVSLIGITSTSEELETAFHSAQEELGASKGLVSCITKIEEIGNGRVVGIFTLKSFDSYVWYDNSQSVYVLDDDNKVTKADIKRVERLIYDNIINELRECDKRASSEIDTMILKCESLRDNVQKYELSKRIALNGEPLVAYLDIRYVDAGINCDKYVQKFLEYGLGLPDGNTAIIIKQTSRLDDAYLRCTCPSVNLDNTDSSEYLMFENPAIIMSCDGGCFIIEKNEWFLVPKDDVLILTLNRRAIENKVSLYAILAWLKSSILAWHSIWKFGNINLFANRSFLRVPSPKIDILKENGTLEQHIKTILQIENQFLVKWIDVMKLEDDSIFEKDRNEHTQEVLIYARAIDKYLFGQFQLSEKDAHIISTTIRSKNIFDYFSITEDSIACDIEKP